MTVPVTVENFVRAESDRMLASFQANAGGMNRFHHNRTPTPIDHQPVIRMNRDTLYSAAVVDISEGARLTLPDSGERYLSVMVVDQDHFINRIIHEPGDHDLTIDEFGTPWVAVAARSSSIRRTRRCGGGQRAPGPARGRGQVGTAVRGARYDTASLDATRAALLELAQRLGNFDHAFGARAEVDPIRHLLATAAGWGGLPDRRPATSASNLACRSANTS